ncbi:hypothetical protein ACF1BE_10285 [Streptomyces sp. NPDC014991]|uniref:hypothetical protein n=1 Tax=Streptomyces sp. NPDC014991 TaxID=3364935 RepID=UPI0036FE7B8B
MAATDSGGRPEPGADVAEPPVIGHTPGLPGSLLGKHPPVNVFDQEGQGPAACGRGS